MRRVRKQIHRHDTAHAKGLATPSRAAKHLQIRSERAALDHIVMPKRVPMRIARDVHDARAALRGTDRLADAGGHARTWRVEDDCRGLAVRHSHTS